MDFKKPIEPDELIEIWCRTERLGTTSMTILMELHGAGRNGDDLRAIIREVQVHVDLDTHRPKPLPPLVRQKFTDFDLRATPVIRGEAM